MRRIIFERYQDECIKLISLKSDIEYLKSEISELEESIASVKRVLLENLFNPADENAEIDDNKLNMLYMRFINFGTLTVLKQQNLLTKVNSYFNKINK